MTKLKIKVTKEILERSKRCGIKKYGVPKKEVGESCAIALAVRDIFPMAHVTRWNICSEGIDVLKSYIKLPTEATHFIDLFDTAGEEMRTSIPEFEFEISIPDEVIEEINIDEIKPLLVNHPTLELIEK
jgi:hypothetical protein